MRIHTIINGDYGRRHVENIRKHAPQDWQIEVWEAARTTTKEVRMTNDGQGYQVLPFPASRKLVVDVAHYLRKEK